MERNLIPKVLSAVFAKLTGPSPQEFSELKSTLSSVRIGGVTLGLKYNALTKSLAIYSKNKPNDPSDSSYTHICDIGAGPTLQHEHPVWSVRFTGYFTALDYEIKWMLYHYNAIGMIMNMIDEAKSEYDNEIIDEIMKKASSAKVK